MRVTWFYRFHERLAQKIALESSRGPRHARAASVAPAARLPRRSARDAAAPAATPPRRDPSRVAGRVVLGTSCTIQEAAAVRAHLLAQAALPGPYEIDGGSVEHVDTAGVQLVVAFALDCLERSMATSGQARSPALEEAIACSASARCSEYPA